MSSQTLCSVWEKWETILLSPGRNKIQWYSETNYFSELNRIDGKSIEFEWKIFPGFATAGILNEIQTDDWANYSVNFSGLQKAGSSSCQCLTTLSWDAKGNDELIMCKYHP